MDKKTQMKKLKRKKINDVIGMCASGIGAVWLINTIFTNEWIWNKGHEKRIAAMEDNDGSDQQG